MNENKEKSLGYERLTEEVILVDGKYYRSMTDEEAADFIWGIDNQQSKED